MCVWGRGGVGFMKAVSVRCSMLYLYSKLTTRPHAIIALQGICINQHKSAFHILSTGSDIDAVCVGSLMACL